MVSDRVTTFRKLLYDFSSHAVSSSCAASGIELLPVNDI